MARSTKFIAVTATTALSLASLSACSSIISPSATADSITIYSNSLADGRKDWLTEEAKKAGFELQLVDAGGGDIYNRLVAEKNSPIADVTFGLNDVFFQKLVAENVLEEYKPSWASTVAQEAVDSSGKYYPIVKEPIMLVCNAEKYKTAAQLPQDWPDLWQKPQFHGRYEVPATLGAATTQMVIAGIMSRHLDQGGKLGVSAQGWQSIKDWYVNGVRSEEGTDLYAQIKSGKVDCGQMWLAGKFSREEQYQINTSAVHPEQGVPMVRQSIALIKDSKKSEQAKKFIDWFGSAELQSKWSKKFFTAPTNKDAEKLGNQEAIKYTNSFIEQKIDWKLVANNLDKWIEEIQLNYVK